MEPTDSPDMPPITPTAPAPSPRERDSLFLMANLRRIGEADSIAVRVRNLSPGGLMAELPTPLHQDTAVEVEVRGIGWIAGRIVWHTAGRAGIAFDRPIDPQLARKPVGVADRIAKSVKPLFRQG